MSRVLAGLLIVVAITACKKGAEPVPSPPPTPRLSPEEVRTRNSLTITEAGGAFALTDGAKRMTLTLPQRPTIDSQTVSESGVQVFNSQAVMPGGPVDVQFGVATILDDQLPPELISEMAGVADQLAAQAGGAVKLNEASTLVGHPGRRFEITTGDSRRLFGWYVAVSEHARMYQLNCVGPDGDASRAACGAVFATLKLAP